MEHVIDIMGIRYLPYWESSIYFPLQVRWYNDVLYTYAFQLTTLDPLFFSIASEHSNETHAEWVRTRDIFARLVSKQVEYQSRKV